MRRQRLVLDGGHARSVPEPRGYPNPDPERPRGQIAGWIVLADGERLAVTVHCIDRYWERAAVGCTLFRYALTRLQQLAAAIGAEGPRPDWAGPEVTGERWIALGPDVGLVAGRRAAVTCLARGSTSRRAHRPKREPAAPLGRSRVSHPAAEWLLLRYRFATRPAVAAPP